MEGLPETLCLLLKSGVHEITLSCSPTAGAMWLFVAYLIVKYSSSCCSFEVIEGILVLALVIVIAFLAGLLGIGMGISMLMDGPSW